MDAVIKKLSRDASGSRAAGIARPSQQEAEEKAVRFLGQQFRGGTDLAARYVAGALSEL
mgnify:CR=1 FL=1